VTAPDLFAAFDADPVTDRAIAAMADTDTAAQAIRAAAESYHADSLALDGADGLDGWQLVYSTVSAELSKIARGLPGGRGR
jgi:hypothetical protein